MPNRKHLTLTSHPLKQLQRHLPSRRVLTLYASCLIVTAAIAIATGLSSRTDPPAIADPFVGRQEAQGFTRYYPAQLPNSYKLDATATSITPEIGTLRIVRETADESAGAGAVETPTVATTDSIVITQQAAIAGFNTDLLYKSFSNRSQHATERGTAVSGLIDNGGTRLTSLITTDGTWILLQSPSSIPLDVITGIVDQLVPSEAANTRQ